jgi:hypothetical protein
VETLAEAVPEFASEVADALSRKGEASVGALVLVSTIERCTFDSSVEATYLYVSQPVPPSPGRAPVARTISFAAPHWFNVDLTHEGGIFGIEILGRPDVVQLLRSAPAL